MKPIVLTAAILLAGTTAFAQDTTTTIKKEQGLFGSQTTIERKSEPSTTSSTVIERRDAVDCSTRTKQSTDLSTGDTTTVKRTEC